VNEREAFIEMVRESPGDDAPRLVMADWFDEQGDDDRAAFIRTQVERSKLPVGSRKLKALIRREQELLAASGHRWLGPLQSLFDKRRFNVTRASWEDAPGVAQLASNGEHVYWDRGFVSAVRTTPGRMRKSGDAALRHEPFDGLRLGFNGTTTAALEGLAGRPYWDRIRHLWLREVGSDVSLGALFASPRLGALESLDLFDVDIQTWADASDGDFLAGVKRLTMNRCFSPNAYARRTTEDAFLALLRAPFWSRLEQLSIEYCYFWAPCVARLMERDPPLRLTHLSIYRTNLEDVMGDTFGRILALPTLTELAIGQTRTDDAQFLAGLRSVTAPAPLERLDLRGNSMPESIVAVATHPIRHTLKRLALPRGPMTRSAVDALIGGFPAGQLESLEVSRTAGGPSTSRLRAHFGSVVATAINEG